MYCTSQRSAEVILGRQTRNRTHQHSKNCAARGEHHNTESVAALFWERSVGVSEERAPKVSSGSPKQRHLHPPSTVGRTGDRTEPLSRLTPPQRRCRECTRRRRSQRWKSIRSRCNLHQWSNPIQIHRWQYRWMQERERQGETLAQKCRCSAPRASVPSSRSRVRR